MTTRKTARFALALLALTLIAPAAGCDWLDPSGSSRRLSPEISGLTVTPRSVFCGDPDNPPGSRNELLIVFSYSDRQEDILRFNLLFEQAQSAERITRVIDFNDPDLSLPPAAGTVSYGDFFFECGGPTAGDWKLTVQAEDERGHLSNTLEADVTLVSSR